MNNLLEQTDLSLSLSKAAYKQVERLQQQRLYDLEKAIFDRKLPVIILYEGWDAAGKGTTIRALTQRLDPRGFKTYAIQAPRTEERRMPWLWRFWMKIPRHGQMAIYDRSWYGRVLVERVENLTPIPDWIRAYEEINEFERTLADDGTIFIKFWLHISREEQLRRFIQISQDKANAWQVTAEDWEHHRKYDEYLAAVDDMLDNTHTSYAPWTVVPATDRYYRLYFVFRVIITALEREIGLTPTVWQTLEELESQAAAAAAEKKARQRAREARKLVQQPGEEQAAQESGGYDEEE
jgi:AMP-polyphosphate phosphotransferase